MQCAVRYGRGCLRVTVPDERIAGVLKPKAVREVADVGAAVERSLRQPFGSPPLRALLAGKKTALIVTVNHTRPSPRRLILPILAACREQDVSPSILIANGRHALMTRQQIRNHLGRDIVRAFPVAQHDAFDEKSMVTRGRTRRGTRIRVNRAVFGHDLVIGVGIIEPSYLCGWSGGRKLLMPGLAHHAAIDNNHFYLTHPDTRIGRLHGNPVSDDAAEFARKLPLHFITYSVSGPDDEITRVVSGHPVKAHEKACRLCERIYRVRAKHAPLVISSPGGAPYDCNLVQGKKAIIPAIDAVERNGVVIICAECPGGLGAEDTFIQWLRHKTPAEVTRDVRDRSQFSLGAHGANILARPIVEKNAKVILVTRPEIARALKGSYVTAVTRLSTAWKLANLLVGDDTRVLLIEKARRLILSEPAASRRQGKRAP